MPTLKRVVASNGERDRNISLYGRLQHLHNTCKKQLAQVGARLGPMLCCALRSEAHATVAYSGPSTIALARA